VYRHVDADHADVDPRHEFARRVAVAGEDGDAVPVLVLARQGERFLEGGSARDNQRRC